MKKGKSLEKALEGSGLDLSDVVMEETVLGHSGTVKGNRMEARVILYYEVEGVTYFFNDVRTFTLKRQS